MCTCTDLRLYLSVLLDYARTILSACHKLLFLRGGADRTRRSWLPHQTGPSDWPVPSLPSRGRAPPTLCQSQSVRETVGPLCVLAQLSESARGTFFASRCHRSPQMALPVLPMCRGPFGPLKTIRTFISDLQ